MRGISTHIMHVCAVPDQQKAKVFVEDVVHWNVAAKSGMLAGHAHHVIEVQERSLPPLPETTR